jgi:hypothetical protein
VIPASPSHPASSWRRRLAQHALRLSAALLPSERISWAAVMRSEAQHLDDDREALSWALGSVRAGAVERLRALRLRRLFSPHALGILWIVIFIVSSAFNVSVALAARLGYQRTATTLGWWIRSIRAARRRHADRPVRAHGSRRRPIQRVPLLEPAQPPSRVHRVLLRRRL